MMKKRIKWLIVPCLFLLCFLLSTSILSKYSTTLSKTITLDIMKQPYVAEVNGSYYFTLQDAIDAVPTTNTRTVVTLLADVDEGLSVASGQNIAFDFQNRTITNTSVTAAVFENRGTIEISNGSIRQGSSIVHAVINNYSGGTVRISGGSIVNSGDRQAIYNNGGTVVISGNPYIKSVSSVRAAVHNNNGTMTITGGTIVSTNYYGLQVTKSVTIGIKDADPNPSSLSIQGKSYGVYATQTFKFYDGTISGETAAINDESKINDKETGYGLQHTVDGTYKNAFLEAGKIVTFNPNGGRVSETTRAVLAGEQVGTLPIPTYTNYTFDGWFDDPVNGNQISSSTIITADIEFYAHWSQILVAEINGTQYYSLQAAINAAPNNTQTTITLVHDVSENVTIAASKDVIFDLQGYTLRNLQSGSFPVIENSGTLEIISGNITTNATNALINNNNGATLKVSGGNLTSTGTRQVIYNNNGGTVEISGNAYLSSTATGAPSNTTMGRGTVQNMAGGTVNITGGTIIGVNQQAISNEGNLTIGDKDGSIIASTPVIRGETYGIVNDGTMFNFYDGKIMGITGTVNGSIDDIETNSQIQSTTEVVDSKTYNVNYLA